jgi:hypothetical protein
VNDMMLWIVALGIGGAGLLLLGLAGVAAVALRSAAARRAQSDYAAPTTAQQTATVSSSPQDQPLSASAMEGLRGGAGPWIWLKACIFALVHALTASFVLGGLTFFEDLVRANDEIRRTGGVSFPAQLLPPSLAGTAGPGSREELPDGAHHQHYRTSAQELRERDLPPIDTDKWEVVDILDEAGPDGEALAGGYHPRE